jgi:hypothetical protein
VAQAALAVLTILNLVKNQSRQLRMIGAGASIFMTVIPLLNFINNPHINKYAVHGNRIPHLEKLDLLATTMARIINTSVNAIHQRLLYGNVGALATACVHLVLNKEILKNHECFR